jgi:hypothetical protein
MTQDQIILLLMLKESKQRGAASMSCDRRLATAFELEKLGFVEWHGGMFGSNFYHITNAGMKALEKTKEKRK